MAPKKTRAEKSAAERGPSSQGKDARGAERNGKPAKSGKPGKKLTADQFLQKLKLANEQLASRPNEPVARLLADNGIGSPFIFLSTQHVRVKRLVAWLRENLFPGTTSSSSSYFGGDLASGASAEPICADLLSLSLFSKNQLIVIYEADKIKASAQKPLIDALERASTGSVLVLACEAVNQKAALLQRAIELGTVVELTELSGPQLERWIEKEVQRAGIASGINGDAKQLLITCYGGDISHLAPEIEKLSLLVVPGEPITRELVEAVSLRNPEVTSFELVRQMAQRNVLRSVALANDLLLQGLHPLQVNSFLSRAFRTLLAQKDQSGAPIASELNNPWFSRQLGSSLNAFTSADLVEAVRTLAKLDFQLKDSGLPSPLALSLAVQHISTRTASA